MIKYRLGCAAGHEFESWFRAIDDYDEQVHSGLVACPSCGSRAIGKLPMAPAVVTGRHGQLPSPSDTLLSGEETGLFRKLRELRKMIIENTEDVGPRFAEEARKMHFGEVEERRIRGNSTLEEARELIEDGVPFSILPPLADDFN